MLGILVLIAGGLGGTYAWAQTQYYVGEAGSEVAIYRGVNASFGPLKFSEVYKNTDLQLDDLTPSARDQVLSGITAQNADDAQNIVDRLMKELKQPDSNCDSSGSTSSTPSGSTSGGPSGPASGGTSTSTSTSGAGTGRTQPNPGTGTQSRSSTARSRPPVPTVDSDRERVLGRADRHAGDVAAAVVPRRRARRARSRPARAGRTADDRRRPPPSRRCATRPAATPSCCSWCSP